VRGHLVLINLADNARMVLGVEPEASAYDTLVVEPIRRILTRYTARVARAQARRTAPLHFPFATLRPYQEAMMAQVQRALEEQRCIMLTAPTGIGKTVAALYPTLTYAIHHGLRVFFVTAKTTQQTLAVDTLQQLAGQGTPFTVVHLRAKAKSCLNEIYYCHESVCEFAHDYTGKLERSGVVESLATLPIVGPDLCAEAGRLCRVCPFELSLDVALEADVIIGDYNYVFDPGAYLRRFFQDTPYDDCILIIDEAHNLYSRGRDYYSPELHQRRLRQLLAFCANEPVRLFRDFEAWFIALQNLLQDLPQAALAPPQTDGFTLVIPPLDQVMHLNRRLETLMIDYAIYRRRHGAAPGGDLLQEFYYEFQRFCDVLALGGDEFAYIYQLQPDNALFKILCKDAARFLHERLQGFHSVIAMSATLTPFPFYQDVLGLPPERTFTAAFPSPFPVKNRHILVVPDVTTTYHERQREAPATAQIIETIVAQHSGNYGVFFSSFAHLRLVRSWMHQYPAECLIEQTPSMSEAERDMVLQSLKQGDTHPMLLLAVQGGIFAEGVDYPGDMLRGVIIVGPGLPQMNHEQELIRAYYEAKYARGFAYAYLYPGMNRVVQSAGRVIRSETDVGIIVLLDKRFTYGNYTALFPTHWYTKTPRELITRNYQQVLARFWGRHA
jgi:DNA excision repair protein ERCC-2